MIEGMIKLINAIANLPNTFWGMIILIFSMRIAIHYNADIGYYFAGVGSTLLGINHLNSIQAKVTNATTNSVAQVDNNASDKTN